MIELPDETPRLTPEPAGRYTSQREEGQGGQSEVLIVQDEHIGRQVAFKQLLPGSDNGQWQFPTTAMRRFLREARLTGQLEHPNIIPVYEIGQRPDGRMYYTMKLVHGRTLAKALEECQSWTDRRKLLGHVMDLCQAMAYSHSRGVIHRDIKTENVMVGEFGETVVLDWGLAHVQGSQDEAAAELLPWEESPSSLRTMAGSIVGTPSYMSPEQAEGLVEEIDERSDVWGLGAVLYEVLTGHPPFEGDTFQVLQQLRQRAVVRPVRQIAPEVPPELAAVAEKALQFKKKERYQSARHIAEEIGSFQSGHGVTAYHYSSRELFNQFVLKNDTSIRVGLIMTGLIFMLLAVAVVRIFLASQEATRQRDFAQKYVNRIMGLPQDLSRLPGSAPVRQKLLNWSLEYYQQQDPRTATPAERRSLAENYLGEADLALDLGRLDQASEAQDKAQSLFEQLAAAGSRASLLDLWNSTVKTGVLALAREDGGRATLQFNRALDLLQKAGDGGDAEQHRLDVATTIFYLGRASQMSGQTAAARELYLKDIEMLKDQPPRRTREDPRGILLQVYREVAEVVDAPQARAALLRAETLARVRLDEVPQDVDRQWDLAECYSLLGETDQAFDLYWRLFRADASRARFDADVAEAACLSGHFAETVQAAQAAVQAGGQDHGLATVAWSYAAIAEGLAGHDKPAADYANRALEEAHQLRGRLEGNFHGALMSAPRLKSPRLASVLALLHGLDAATRDGNVQGLQDAIQQFRATLSSP